MSLIGEILPISHTILDLDVSSKKHIFEQVGLLSESETRLVCAGVFGCLFVREKLNTTRLGQGAVVPRGRHTSMKEAVGVFIRTKEPVALDAPDGKPISLVFVLLIPKSAAGEHLEVLSKLAGKPSQKTVRETLMAAVLTGEARNLLAVE